MYAKAHKELACGPRLNVGVSFILAVTYNYLIHKDGCLCPQTATKMKMPGGCFCLSCPRIRAQLAHTNPNIPIIGDTHENKPKW